MFSPWVALLLVCALPILVLYSPGRGWLLGSTRSRIVWTVLGACALVGALGFLGLLPYMGDTRTYVVLVVPMLQAATFVLLEWLFHLLVGRVPVPYDQARYGHTERGTIFWLDRMFWVAIRFGLTFGGVIIS